MCLLNKISFLNIQLNPTNPFSFWFFTCMRDGLQACSFNLFLGYHLIFFFVARNILPFVFINQANDMSISRCLYNLNSHYVLYYYVLDNLMIPLNFAVHSSIPPFHSLQTFTELSSSSMLVFSLPFDTFMDVIHKFCGKRFK